MSKCRLLLLGGIGSGKSTVAKLFQEYGADIVDADQVGHEVLRLPTVISDIEVRWPEAVIDGVVDRVVLAAAVFVDPVELGYLESITHPEISRRIEGQVAVSPSDLVVVEMPLVKALVEGEWIVVVVDAPDEIRLARSVARGMEPSDARTRMQRQPSRQEFLDHADEVIDNGGSMEDLRPQVERVLEARCGRITLRRSVETRDGRRRPVVE